MLFDSDSRLELVRVIHNIQRVPDHYLARIFRVSQIDLGNEIISFLSISISMIFMSYIQRYHTFFRETFFCERIRPTTSSRVSRNLLREVEMTPLIWPHFFTPTLESRGTALLMNAFKLHLLKQNMTLICTECCHTKVGLDFMIFWIQIKVGYPYSEMMYFWAQNKPK